MISYFTPPPIDSIGTTSKSLPEGIYFELGANGILESLPGSALIADSLSPVRVVAAWGPTTIGPGSENSSIITAPLTAPTPLWWWGVVGCIDEETGTEIGEGLWVVVPTTPGFIVLCEIFPAEGILWALFPEEIIFAPPVVDLVVVGLATEDPDTLVDVAFFPIGDVKISYMHTHKIWMNNIFKFH